MTDMAMKSLTVVITEKKYHCSQAHIYSLATNRALSQSTSLLDPTLMA